jgi:hypothetical protein
LAERGEASLVSRKENWMELNSCLKGSQVGPHYRDKTSIGHCSLEAFELAMPVHNVRRASHRDSQRFEGIRNAFLIFGEGVAMKKADGDSFRAKFLDFFKQGMEIPLRCFAEKAAVGEAALWDPEPELLWDKDFPWANMERIKVRARLSTDLEDIYKPFIGDKSDSPLVSGQ